MPAPVTDTLGILSDKRLGEWIAQREKTTVVAVADAAATLTAAQIIDSKVFKQTPTAARTLTTDTAALIVAAATGYAVGTSFDFSIINLAAATYSITLAGGTGVTIVGVATVAPVTSAMFRAVIDSATAVSVYRLA